MAKAVDAVAVWVRGETLFVRFPHSHTVRLPISEAGTTLRRILHAREMAKARLSSAAEAKDMPTGPLQAEVGQWVDKGNKVKVGEARSAITGARVRETKEQEQKRSYWNLRKQLEVLG